MNFKQIILVLTFVEFSVCENPFRPGGSRIVNGELIEIDEVPYYGSLNNDGEHWCGGSLISTRWLLSAGHCVGTTTDLTKWKIRFGSSRASRGGKLYEVNKITVHPQYDSSKTNYDFALFRTRFGVTLTDRVQIIKLAAASFVITDGAKTLTSGLGETQNDEESTEFLRGAVVLIQNMAECNASYSYQLTDVMICAGTDFGQDSCQGDSGGPLEYIKDGTLVGVVSFGMGCGDANFPGVYSYIPKVRSWITTVANV